MSATFAALRLRLFRLELLIVFAVAVVTALAFTAIFNEAGFICWDAIGRSLAIWALLGAPLMGAFAAMIGARDRTAYPRPLVWSLEAASRRPQAVGSVALLTAIVVSPALLVLLRTWLYGAATNAWGSPDRGSWAATWAGVLLATLVGYGVGTRFLHGVTPPRFSTVWFAADGFCNAWAFRAELPTRYLYGPPRNMALLLILLGWAGVLLGRRRRSV